MCVCVCDECVCVTLVLLSMHVLTTVLAGRVTD